MLYAIRLPDRDNSTITQYLSDRGEPDFANYAETFSLAQAELALAFCEAGSTIVEHPNMEGNDGDWDGGDDDDTPWPLGGYPK
jgi:hypothetical protein